MDSIDGTIATSMALRLASQGGDRAVSVLKKQLDISEDAIQKLLANSFNGVGQMVSRMA